MNYDDLKRLDELRKSGAISEEEYEKEKQKIFDQTKSDSKPLLGLTENSYLALMHISQFAGIIVPGLGFAAPIILWLINKDNNSNVDATGKHIINFMISMFIYYAVAGVLCCLVIGIPLLVALGIIQIIFVIIATIKANNGEKWRYPFTIDFLK
ncbi:MAG: DUF4870 domain-containing protein [Candidatus Azobacteroides sp.]|nr:DUF4870 domain-containing protein [Candidatus Azobacteroides sp.]